MLETIFTYILYSSPVIALITYLIYLFLKRYINSKFEINMAKQIEDLKNCISKDFVIFEKRKEALSEVLLETSRLLIKIKSNFCTETWMYNLVDEKYCNEFELNISKSTLYMNDQSTDVVNLILNIIKKNSSKIRYLVGEEESYFDSSDIIMLEYIYSYLTKIFRKELFNDEVESNYDEVKYLELAFIMKHFSVSEKIDKNELKLYDYTNQPVLEAVKQIRASRDDVIRLLKIAILDYESSKSPSQYQYDYIQKAREFLIFLEEK